MGINIEFNPDLALREYNAKDRKKEECLPEIIEKGRLYRFLKKGQRNYWLNGEIPLRETKGNQKLSNPLASIIIIEESHFLEDNEIYTRGVYEVIEAYNPDDTKIHFNGYEKIK
jgi:hypothetical protein